MLDDSVSGKLPFEYLHSELVKDRLEHSPLYAIEFSRFMKVIRYAGLGLNEEQVEGLAMRSNALRKNKTYGFYIYYDRLLMIIRESCMTRDEIDNIKSAYS